MTRARDLSKLSNSQVFSIDNNFNVGINSTVPAATLDVRGNSVITGVLTATSFSGTVDATGLTGSPSITVTDITASGNVSIAGTLTYEDVTNIDAVGVITARSDVSIADKIIHTGDTNTAIRFPAADTFTVETSGSERLRVTSAGLVGIGTDNPSTKLHLAGSGTQTLRVEETGSTVIGKLFATTSKVGLSAQSNHPLSLEVNNDEKARIDTSGRLLLATTSAEDSAIIQSNGVSPASFYRASGSGGPNVSLKRSRGNLPTVYTVVQDDDNLGTVNFSGTDGSAYVTGASIIADVDGTPGSNDMPGRLEFHTTADGASSPTERLRIDSSGNVIIGATNADSFKFKVSNGAGTLARFTDGTSQTLDIRQASGGIELQNPNNGFVSIKGSSAERLRVDSSGRLLIGHTSSINTGGVDSHLQVVGTDTEKSSLSLARFVNDSGEPFLIFAKSRNGTKGGNTVVQDDDTIGRISFQGADGTDYEEAASIKGEVDGAPGGEATDMPGRLLFGTTADGDHNATERLRIDSRGSFQFSNGFMNETVKINTTARTGTQAVNLDDGMVHYFSTNSSGTWKPNFTMSAGDDINATIATGDVFSPTMIVAKGATSHYATTIQVDGSDVTPEFSGGAPSDGGGSGTFDVYNYTIIKTGDDTFKAFAAVSTYE